MWDEGFFSFDCEMDTNNDKINDELLDVTVGHKTVNVLQITAVKAKLEEVLKLKPKVNKQSVQTSSSSDKNNPRVCDCSDDDDKDANSRYTALARMSREVPHLSDVSVVEIKFCNVLCPLNC